MSHDKHVSIRVEGMPTLQLEFAGDQDLSQFMTIAVQYKNVVSSRGGVGEYIASPIAKTESLRLPLVDQRRQDKQLAAVMLQKVWRGRQARKEYRAMVKSVVTAQKMIRGTLARKLVKQVRTGGNLPASDKQAEYRKRVVTELLQTEANYVQ